MTPRSRGPANSSLAARLTALPLGHAHDATSPLLALLAGTAPPYLPVPAADAAETARLCHQLGADAPIDPEVALVVATSGSTGIPKGALLTAAALRASAVATHARLGGPGQWLLALPAHHIAGIQVILRSLAAGHPPVAIDVRAGFDPAALTAAFARMTSGRRYLSLVPTQLIKCLTDPAAMRTLTRFDAVLIGGAALPKTVLGQAQEWGVAVVRTYGMSETCGGCVYDGVPLDGVTVRIDPESSRVLLGGSVIARGYRNAPDHAAFAQPGWFATDDAGVITDGVLTITGRLDDGISTGGLTVLPQVVEAAIAGCVGVTECAVFGLPDERLGQQVACAIVGSATDAQVRAAVSAQLDRTAVPRSIFRVSALPMRGPGKVDRRALVRRFSGAA